MMEHRKLTKDLKFHSQIQLVADGALRGIVIMWKEQELKLNNISITPQGVHFLVKVYPNENAFFFSTIYASLELGFRMQL